MDMSIVLLSIYLLSGLIISLSLLKSGPITLMAGSTFFLVYVSLPSIGMSESQYEDFAIVGKILTLFFSIICAAMYSTAWNELRKKVRSDDN